jgi:hypothetical protein
MLGPLRLRTVDYFDVLVNQIDFKAESLLAKLDFSQHGDINLKRQEFIDEIKRAEAFNLEHLFKRFKYRIGQNFEQRGYFREILLHN